VLCDSSSLGHAAAVQLDDGTATAGQYDPAQAATNARKMVSDKEVVAAIGPQMSGSGKAMSPILSQGDLATITPSSTNPGCSRSGSASRRPTSTTRSTNISVVAPTQLPGAATAPRPGQLRAGACNAAGAWVDVPAIPGCFIVNLGDLMARWTNDAWVSTLHRVVNPPPDAGAERRSTLRACGA
jgi:2-oxoglutarate-Fe(II)-dependent oxygenase superfamily protein